MHTFDLLGRAISISALGDHICEARARMHEEIVDQGEQRMKRTKVWDHEGFAANKEGVPFLLTVPPGCAVFCSPKQSRGKLRHLQFRAAQTRDRGISSALQAKANRPAGAPAPCTIVQTHNKQNPRDKPIQRPLYDHAQTPATILQSIR